MGIKIYDEIFNKLRFADDIVLASEDPEELPANQARTTQWSKQSCWPRNKSIKDSGHVQQPEHHDRWVSTKSGHLIHVPRPTSLHRFQRIGFGWQAFGRASSIFRSKLPNYLKRYI